jgi:F-type H+-transporting ATPase subunit delta
MNEGIITARYAKALYQLGEEEGKTDALRADIELLQETMSEIPEFLSFLQSPIMKESAKTSLYKQVFSDKVDPLVINFLNLLTQNRRESHLPAICRYFQQLYKESKGIRDGVIITAKPIDKKQLQEVHQLIKRLFKTDIELTEQLDESIIGGFKLRIEDQQIDASIATKIRKIRSELINS